MLAGEAPGVAAVERRMPQRVKRKRVLMDDEDGFEVSCTSCLV